MELSTKHLRLLRWFAEWTPAVHKADWETRRRWPPGYRKIADVSIGTAEVIEKAKREMSLPPNGTADRAYVRDLIAHGLVEGTMWVARLTLKGAMTLKEHGLRCPEQFASHAKDVFDPVRFEATKGWRDRMPSYVRDDLNALDRGSAQLCITSSNGQYLNGSIRKHNRYVCLHVRGPEQLLEMSMSFEQLASLLTGSIRVPVTLEWFLDHEGMPQSREVRPALNIQERMKARLQEAEAKLGTHLDELAEMVKKCNLSKKRTTEMLREIEVVRSHSEANKAFVAEQATEEISAVVEVAGAMLSDQHPQLGNAALPQLSSPPQKGDDA